MLRNEETAPPSHDHSNINPERKNECPFLRKIRPGACMFEEANNEIDVLAGQLNENLSKLITFVVAYEPYATQAGIDQYLDKGVKNSDKIFARYMEKYDVNVSNNLGMTLLHSLLWLGRTDLAKPVIKHSNFTKINYKFSLPFDMAVMYASALDLAITGWLTKCPEYDLEFIELMLKYGAQPPVPGKKFLSEEMVSTFYPDIACTEGTSRTHEELINLFTLMHRYGFSVDAMEEDFQKRLFDTENDWNNRAQEFEQKYKVSIDNQKVIFADFIKKLKESVANDQLKPELQVELSPERMDNGQDTLQLPFDPHDRPCCVM